MNFMSLKTSKTKKLLMLSSLLCFHSVNLASKEPKTIVLTSPLLRVADSANLFHEPIIDILQTRIDIVNFIQGTKEWVGTILNLEILNSNNTLTIYCRRPEIIFGATFIVIAPDHELAATLTTFQHKKNAHDYIATIENQTLYDRQINSTNDGYFTGSYAINPMNGELLPIYISDYAIESFDIRQAKTRLGIPAHNSKDLEFARKHDLPIKVVVDVPKYDIHGHPMAAPIFDKHGNLKEAYLGEYRECILVNSAHLNNLSLKDGMNLAIQELEAIHCAMPHKEILQYNYNNQLYNVKDLAKLETALHKNAMINHQTNELKKDLRIALNYAQADFIEITEKFMINVKNTKALMVALIEESCALREIANCYLLQWCHIHSNDNEKEIFRRDIISVRDFTLFCKDLVNFLGDLAHSCPKALENVKNQNVRK